jgi:putative tricarboxylic transport membrane protein
MDRRIDLAVAVAFTAFGAWIILQATAIKSGMMRDPIGPRTAFYVTGGILAIGGIILIVRSLRSWDWTASHIIPSEGVEDEAAYPASARRAFLLIGACMFYGLTFDPLGYLIATPLFIVVSLLILGERSRLGIPTIAILFTAITYVVFAQSLGVRVPVGPLTEPFRALGLINL